MVSVCVGVYRLNDWYAGDIARVIELAALAERKGVDQINITGRGLATRPTRLNAATSSRDSARSDSAAW
jgi:hypothetical protein